MALKYKMKSKPAARSGKWKWGFCTLLCGALFLIVSSYLFREELLAKTELLTSADILLIDPGHGGMDGGAESALGVSEKDINLTIALEIKELAIADGWKVVMTREEDVGLYTEGEGRSIRSMKTEDLKKRKEMVDDEKPLLAVSIHLNSFKEDRSVRGAQTFYPSGSGEEAVLEESKALAEVIQKQLVTGLNDGTDRVALGKKDVMLFKNPTVPTVIVECGFLSNRQEAELLQSEEYQKKLAECIYRGVMEHTGKEAGDPVTILDSLG